MSALRRNIKNLDKNQLEKLSKREGINNHWNHESEFFGIFPNSLNDERYVS